MQRVIVFDDDNSIDNVSPVNEPDEGIGIADNADDYEEVIRRQDDIDQLTADYLRALIGIDGEMLDLGDLGIDIDSLNAIEDAIEDLLNDFGITIYRPTIIEDENGHEIIVSSVYDINE